MTANRDHPRGEIHLGDLIRALDDLPWKTPKQKQSQLQSQAHAAAVAACLGFGLTPPSAPSASTPRKVYDRRTGSEPPPATSPPPREPPVFVPPTPPRPLPLPEGTLASQLTELPQRAPPGDDPPDWLRSDQGAAAFPPEPEPKLARATLLPEGTARHVLSAALGTTRPGGPVHLARLIDALCRREPLKVLPRRLETTLERGCDLLLDHSGSMVPFWEDLKDLTTQVGDLIGREATRVYSFDSRPTQARGWTPAGEPRPWRPDGRPVLVATDLGIQGRGAPESLSGSPVRPHLARLDPDWAKFARHCAKTGSPLILLIPWPEQRWPRAFAANATLVHWGPHTTAGMLRRRTGGR